jgi:hypothetical protein
MAAGDKSIIVEVDHDVEEVMVCYENSGYAIPIEVAVRLRDQLRSFFQNASTSESGSAADNVSVTQIKRDCLTVDFDEPCHGWCDLAIDDAKDLLDCLDKEVALGQ